MDYIGNGFELKENETGYTLIITDGIKEVTSEIFSSIWELAEDETLKITEVCLPDSVTRIKDDTFAGFPELTNVRMSQNIEIIGDGAFRACKNLTNIDFPEGLIEIGEKAFENCSSLTDISLPKSLTLINRSVFSDCHALERINLHNNINQICENAFSGCSRLKEIIIPANVTILESGVFCGCTNLTDIRLPNRLTEIHSKAFTDCLSLNHMVIPESVSVIKRYAFGHCSGLKSIILPKHLKTIEGRTFYECVNLSDVKFPEDLQKIDSFAFENCHSLKTLEFPKTLCKLGLGSFRGCGNLESAVLPSSVKKLHEDVFQDCYSLTNIGSNCFDRIDGHAFDGCVMLNVNFDINGSIDPELFYKDGANIIIPIPHSPTLNIEKFETNAGNKILLSYSIDKHQMLIALQGEIQNRERFGEDIIDVIEFLKEPTYGRLMKLKNISNKIILAVAYNGYDKRFIDYTKRYLLELIEYIGETNSLDLLDYLIDKKILNKRNINKVVDSITEEDSRELYLTLVSLKNEMGGYDKKCNRFEL